MSDPQPPQNAGLVRQGFGEMTSMTGIEMQAQALAAQVKAAVEARYILAMRRPRDLLTVRTKLMAECRRPRFADEARYSVPRGRKKDERTGEWVDVMVEGPSIRFAEAAVRSMTNVDTTSMVIYDDANARTVRVTAIDLESNVTYSKDVTIVKTKEQRQLRQNQVPIGERYTSAGNLVHIVAIPDSELQNVQAAAESKALRGLILRLLPGDITEECMDLCQATLKDEHAKDPAEAMKKMCDGFARLGVRPDELATYLGHPLDQMTPAEYQHLRSLGVSLRDGQINWPDALEQKLDGRPISTPAPAAAAEPSEAPKDVGQVVDVVPPAGPAKEPQKAKGTKAVTAAVKAAKAPAAPSLEPQPVPLAANVPPVSSQPPPREDIVKTQLAPTPAPPEPDPHGDPPPPDDVVLPGAGVDDAPDWMK